jgi:hypothetical protein
VIMGVMDDLSRMVVSCCWELCEHMAQYCLELLQQHRPVSSRVEGISNDCWYMISSKYCKLAMNSKKLDVASKLIHRMHDKCKNLNGRDNESNIKPLVLVYALKMKYSLAANDDDDILTMFNKLKHYNSRAGMFSWSEMEPMLFEAGKQHMKKCQWGEAYREFLESLPPSSINMDLHLVKKKLTFMVLLFVPHIDNISFLLLFSLFFSFWFTYNLRYNKTFDDAK